MHQLNQEVIKLIVRYIETTLPTIEEVQEHYPQFEWRVSFPGQVVTCDCDFNRITVIFEDQVIKEVFHG